MANKKKANDIDTNALDMGKAIEKASKEKEKGKVLPKKNTPSDSKIYGRKSHVVNKDDREKITITLSKEVVREMDVALISDDLLIEKLGHSVNRSHLIERAVYEYLNGKKRL